MIEGEEEIGSPGLDNILDIRKKEIQADHLVIVDVDLPNFNTPTINLGCRGICTLELELTGANSDLHSGLFGGVVYNPIRALCEIFSKMHNETGQVTIPDFYKDIKTLTDLEKNSLYLNIDENAFKIDYKTCPNGGENAYSPLERMGLRPTFEINGIWGGYTDEGFKTVIPSKAFAKVSMRLVPYQDPDKIKKNFSEYIQNFVPDGMSLKITSHSQPAPAHWCNFNSKLAQAAQWAFTEVFNKPCLKFMGGGSLPIAAKLEKASSSDTICIGTALPSDKIHAPNEHFSIDQFKKGYLVITQLIEKLAHS